MRPLPSLTCVDINMFVPRLMLHLPLSSYIVFLECSIIIIIIIFFLLYTLLFILLLRYRAILPPPLLLRAPPLQRVPLPLLLDTALAALLQQLDFLSQDPPRYVLVLRSRSRGLALHDYACGQVRELDGAGRLVDLLPAGAGALQVPLEGLFFGNLGTGWESVFLL